MSFYLPETASAKSDVTAKNRVWGFFAESVSESLESRRAALETHRENYGGPGKTASGIPLWPSRDPIGERGGVNLYAFVGNDGISRRDYLGLIAPPLEPGSTIEEWSVACECEVRAGALCMRDPYPKDTLTGTGRQSSAVESPAPQDVGSVPNFDNPERLSAQILQARKRALDAARDQAVDSITDQLDALVLPWAPDVNEPIGSVSCSCEISTQVFQYAGTAGETEWWVPTGPPGSEDIDEILDLLDQFQDAINQIPGIPHPGSGPI